MDPIAIIIATAALQIGVPADLLQAVCWVETHHRNVVTVHDGKDSSMGACQVKPQTARMMARLNRKKFYSSDLLNVEKNAMYAALYLKYQLNRYKGNVWAAVDAYNKGTARPHEVKQSRRNNAKKSSPKFDSLYSFEQTKYIKAVRQALEVKPWMVVNANRTTNVKTDTKRPLHTSSSIERRCSKSGTARTRFTCSH